MKKAFNNPVVVGVLVLLAAAFVFRDFIHFSSTTQTKNAFPVARVQSPLKTPATVSFMPSNPKKSSSLELKRTDWNRIAKMSLSERDPFSPEAMVLPQQAETSVNDSPDRVGMPEMTLNAIVATENIHYVTINGQVLKKGEMIDSWKLVAIGVNRVQLRGSSGLLTLDIDGGMRMGGKALKPAKRKPLARQGTKAVTAPIEKTSIPDSMEDLNMYQGLFDSLKKSGIVPELPRTRIK